MAWSDQDPTDLGETVGPEAEIEDLERGMSRTRTAVAEGRDEVGAGGSPQGSGNPRREFAFCHGWPTERSAPERTRTSDTRFRKASTVVS